MAMPSNNMNLDEWPIYGDTNEQLLLIKISSGTIFGQFLAQHFYMCSNYYQLYGEWFQYYFETIVTSD